MRRRAVLGVLVAVLALAPDKPDPKKFTISRDEQTFLDLTNKERAKAKLPPLQPNAILFQVARAHSANMLKQGKMEHELDGKRPAQRVEAAGYDYKRVGENVAHSEDDASLEMVMKALMDSKVHREHILKDNYTEIGVGIARNSKGEAYYTQVFATPMKK